jgi:hypothetical protein
MPDEDYSEPLYRTCPKCGAVGGCERHGITKSGRWIGSQALRRAAQYEVALTPSKAAGSGSALTPAKAPKGSDGQEGGAA